MRRGWTGLVLGAALLLALPVRAQDAPAEQETEAEADVAAADAEAAPEDGEASPPAEEVEDESPPAETAPEDDDPDVRMARRHYSQGAAFFRNERYDEAIAEFMEAYALWPNPTVLYSLGQAYERILRAPQAIRFYRRYLDAAPADDARREEVELKIRALRMLLGTLRIESNVPAVVYADDDEVGEAPGDIQLTTGRYRIELRAEGYVSSEQPVTIAAQTERTLTFELAVVEPTQVVVEGQGGIEPGWFWAGLVATGLGAVTAGVLGGVTLDMAAAYDANPLRRPEDQDDGRRMANATDVAFGITGAFAIATIVLALVADWGDDEEEAVEDAESVALRIRPGAVALVW